MAHYITLASGAPPNNVSETTPFDHIMAQVSGAPLAPILPPDFFQCFNAPSTVDPLSLFKLSPYESEISGGDGSGTSHASSPASPPPTSSAPPTPASTKDNGSPKGRSKPSVAMRRIKREEETARKVGIPPATRTFPRRATQKPATYVYDVPCFTSSPPLSDFEPDSDEEWKPDDSMTSDREDDAISNINNDHKTTRPDGIPLIAPPTNAAIASSGRTERQWIRSFAQQREIHKRTPGSGSAEWVHHRGQFLCKAIVRQASKKGRAKWLPGCEPEVGKPCNQLLGTYQDWERHFSCSQWHQAPDTCRFCAKSLNVRSVERHLGKFTTSRVWPYSESILHRCMQELQAPVHPRTLQALSWRL
jgi:hypothetical protein